MFGQPCVSDNWQATAQKLLVLCKVTGLTKDKTNQRLQTSKETVRCCFLAFVEL